MSNDKRTVYVGGLADEVTERLLNNAFIPFGDIADIQMPVDYESQRHRGFAFVEYENYEDAAAAIENMVSPTETELVFRNKLSAYIFFRMIPSSVVELYASIWPNRCA